MRNSVIEQILSGVTALTPTRRLASHCNDKVAAYCAKQSQVWEKPSILSFEDWLKVCWEEFELKGKVDWHLITPTQSLLLLEKIISEHHSGKSLLSPFQSAKTVFGAWKILHQWKSLDLLDVPSLQVDERAFQEWIEAYRKILNAHHAIDHAMQSNCILEVLSKEPPRNLILYGFEEKTPFLDHFLNKLEERKWQIFWESACSIEPTSLVRQAFQDEEQEQCAAVAFAKSKFEAGLKSIAIVVPQLADYRQKLDAKLRDAFDPLEVMIPLPTIFPHYNISAAIPLINYPLVQSALMGLRLGLSCISLKDYQYLVDTPWLHNQDENSQNRYQHLQRVKKWHRGPLTLKQILHYLKQQEEDGSCWASRLEAFYLFYKTLPQKATFYEWSSHFRALLELLKWPFNHALSSTEYQSLFRFEKLLQELWEADIIGEKVSYACAFFTLQKLISYIPFQPENKGAKVQVLGLLEAAGQTFDALWVMGMQSEMWPPPAKHNPFIDIRVQREREMPHASAQREMQYAKKMTERLKQSANEIVFSYPLQNKERVFEPSELICDLPMQSASIHNLNANKAESYFFKVNDDNIEFITDETAPSLLATDNIRASARLLESQSACPFKAFAEYRLGATELVHRTLWLQTSEKGMIIHEVLEAWWKRYPHSSDLLNLSEDEKQKVLNELIEEKLCKVLNPKVLSTHYEVEKTRLQTIFKSYFALEAKQESFTVIHTEYAQTFAFRGLTFHLRCDRVDERKDNQHYIIDYKTGQFSVSDWENERIKAPQLPLYTLAFDDPYLSGVKILQLNTKECRYQGIDTKEALEEIKPFWQQELAELTDEFVQGKAIVSPRNKTTCQYCHLHALCRVYEKEALNDL